MSTTTVHSVTPDLIGEALEEVDVIALAGEASAQDMTVQHHGHGRITVTLWGALGGGELEQRRFTITEDAA